MRIKQNVLELLNTQETRSMLSLALGCSEFTILRYLKSNSDNLTKVAAMNVIKKQTGFKQADILEASDVNTAKVA